MTLRVLRLSWSTGRVRSRPAEAFRGSWLAVQQREPRWNRRRYDSTGPARATLVPSCSSGSRPRAACPSTWPTKSGSGCVEPDAGHHGGRAWKSVTRTGRGRAGPICPRTSRSGPPAGRSGRGQAAVRLSCRAAARETPGQRPRAATRPTDPVPSVSDRASRSWTPPVPAVVDTTALTGMAGPQSGSTSRTRQSWRAGRALPPPRAGGRPRAGAADRRGRPDRCSPIFSPAEQAHVCGNPREDDQEARIPARPDAQGGHSEGVAGIGPSARSARVMRPVWSPTGLTSSVRAGGSCGPRSTAGSSGRPRPAPDLSPRWPARMLQLPGPPEAAAARTRVRRAVARFADDAVDRSDGEARTDRPAASSRPRRVSLRPGVRFARRAGSAEERLCADGVGSADPGRRRPRASTCSSARSANLAGLDERRCASWRTGSQCVRRHGGRWRDAGPSDPTDRELLQPQRRGRACRSAAGDRRPTRTTRARGVVARFGAGIRVSTRARPRVRVRLLPRPPSGPGRVQARSAPTSTASFLRRTPTTSRWLATS